MLLQAYAGSQAGVTCCGLEAKCNSFRSELQMKTVVLLVLGIIESASVFADHMDYIDHYMVPIGMEIARVDPIWIESDGTSIYRNLRLSPGANIRIPVQVCNDCLTYSAAGVCSGVRVYEDGWLMFKEEDGWNADVTRLVVKYNDWLAEYELWRNSDGRHNKNPYMEFQVDGNLVKHDDSGPVWSSNTSENYDATLHLQPDGNLVIHNSANEAIWSTHTQTPTDDKYRGIKIYPRGTPQPLVVGADGHCQPPAI